MVQWTHCYLESLYLSRWFHRSLGVHISFVRSIAMDSWTPQQLALMKNGGNDKCANYLKSKGIAPNTPIKQKYESDEAQLYKEILKVDFTIHLPAIWKTYQFVLFSAECFSWLFFLNDKLHLVLIPFRHVLKDVPNQQHYQRNRTTQDLGLWTIAVLETHQSSQMQKVVTILMEWKD